MSSARALRGPLVMLTSLFFLWGLITSLNDILIPHLKGAFSLTYVQAMLIQFCFFGAYFVVSLPAGALVQRVGYPRGIVIGLAIAGAGCLLFLPAAAARDYTFFLGALFVLASGITLLQVAANPYVTLLGPPESASTRLTLTQAFNSLGTTVGPLFGSLLILGGAQAAGGDAAAGAESVQVPYLGLAIALLALAVFFGTARLPRLQDGVGSDAVADDGGVAALWGRPRLMFGVLGIFLYVGSEVSIGSFLVNFMAQPDVAGLPEETAGRYLALYWGGAMVGRFVGAAVMTRVRPAVVLGVNALVAVALIATAIVVGGRTAMWSLLAVGLFNSIMFPTLFALALTGLGARTGRAAGLLCMAIVGGALLPLLQGYLADHAGLALSFVVPLAGYLYIAGYGLRIPRA